MGKSIVQALMNYVSGNDEMCIFVSDFTDNSYEIIIGKKTKTIISPDKEPLSQLCSNEHIHPSDSVVLTSICSELLSNEKTDFSEEIFSFSFRADISECSAKQYEWFMLTLLLNRNDDSSISSVIGHIRYMTSAEKQNRAVIDSFTNDKHPQVYAGQSKRVLETYEKVAFVQFDIEKFKVINSKYGEEKGTEILNFINNGLDAVCSSDQVHLRMSADMFMIVAGYSDKTEITDLIYKIQSCLSKYEDIEYKFAFGVNYITDKSIPLRKMGDRAALARQSIKGNALTNIGYYNDEQENGLFSRKEIEDRMHYALTHNEFVMFLQPKYRISKESIEGAEALVRWIHPEKGLISPSDFIPVFEKNGFIIMLDEYIWEQACKTLRSWIDMGKKPIPISVNISRVHLSDDLFIEVLDSLVEKYDIPKHLLETEITETVENDKSDQIIRHLKEHGYTLLMDDFGSGYSSLNMLNKTQFDVIKIDREFFSEYMLSDRGKKIISHTIDMSKDIGLDLVAEGVETKEQSEFLTQCGCDVAQGFLYSRPLTVEAFNKLAYGI